MMLATSGRSDSAVNDLVVSALEQFLGSSLEDSWGVQALPDPEFPGVFTVVSFSSVHWSSRPHSKTLVRQGADLVDLDGFYFKTSRTVNRRPVYQASKTTVNKLLPPQFVPYLWWTPLPFGAWHVGENVGMTFS